MIAKVALVCSLLDNMCGEIPTVGDCKKLSKACHVPARCVEGSDYISPKLLSCIENAVPKCHTVCGFPGISFWHQLTAPGGSLYGKDKDR